MYTLKFTNSNNNTITLTQNDNFIITLLDGFYSSSATINTTKVGTIPGERLASKSVNKRGLGVHFSIQKDVVKNRQSLYGMFRTGDTITVYYKNELREVTIEAIVEDITISPHEMKTTSSITFQCPAPFFNDINEIIDGVSKIVDNFHFPFSIENPGIPFSYLDMISEVNIFNGGDVTTGMKIILRTSVGQVENPVIYNRMTTEYIGLGNENNPFILLVGDEVVFDTDKKKVYLIRNGVNNNIFNLLKSGTTWLTLNAGDNVFTYDADDGLEHLEIDFIHQDKYEGV